MLFSQQIDNLILRRGVPGDLDFIAGVDRRGEGSASSYADGWTEDQWTRRRHEMLGFINDDDKFTFVLSDTPGRSLMGAILGRFVNIKEPLPEWSVFRMLPAELFPENGWLCEIFDLWVDPDVRRRGIATRLKLEAECEAIRRGIGAIYTHTDSANDHVIALNLKLGYREIRRGPIWDNVVRVSLLKTLPA